MVTQHLYEPFEIEYRELNECPMEAHKHTFFEMVYIMDGEGVQCVNKNKLPYSAGKLFLLMPQDCHSFEVKTVTRFLFIRFNHAYLKTQSREWVQKLEFIFQHNNHLPGCIVKNKNDKPLLRSLVEALIREQVNQQQYHKELTQQLVNTIITVVARNIIFQQPASLKMDITNETSQHILHYIHENIYEPEKLRATKIAANFNLSPNYVGEYFKKYNGGGLQQYIMGYKLKLAEARLQYSDLRIGEIAAELGFTDESHLNRVFKKHSGFSPSAYRKNKTTMSLSNA